MERDAKGRFVSAKTQVKNKYTPGTFGYWWTVIKGNKDIEGQVYEGDINCGYSNLTSLQGAPEKVDRSFSCRHNNLTSLEGAPKEVGGSFYCYSNNLTSLQGAPKKVGGNFWCDYNKLISLESTPTKVGGSFSCSHNNLSSLQGAPKEVGWGFYCENNKLISLEGAPKEIGGGFSCENNNLTSLKGAPEKVSGNFSCYSNKDLKALPDILKAARIFGDVYHWKGSTWSFFDGVQKEVAKVRKAGALTVYTMKDGTFAVYDGEAYAHGVTLKEAKKDLLYKRTSRDLTEFEGYTMDTEMKIEDAIRMYRSITGACAYGTRSFCERLELKKEYTLKEIIEITEGAYGNEKLKEFFKKGK